MHQQQCALINESTTKSERQHYSKTYGINRESALSQLEAFDVTEQVPPDVMHVLLEGVVPRHIGQFLKHVVQGEEAISLEELNRKIQSFPYSYFELDTKPSKIPLSAIQEGNLTGKQIGMYRSL